MSAYLSSESRRGPAQPFWGNSILLAVGDMAVLALALFAGRLLIYMLADGPLALRYSLFLLPAWCVGAAISGLLPGWGLGAVEEMRRVQLLLIGIFAMGGVAYFFGRAHFYPSRLAYVISWLVSAACIPFVRAGLKGLLHRAGAWGCPAVIYGDRETAEKVIEAFRDMPAIGYRPVGVFSDQAPVGAQIGGLDVLGSMEERTAAADVAVAPMFMAEQPLLADRYDSTLAGYRHVLLLPDIRESVFMCLRPRALGSLLGMEIAGNLLNPFSRAVKWGMDLVLILLWAPVWIPLLALITAGMAIAERQTPFYLQERRGRHGRSFRLIKFRTMVTDADVVLERLLDRDPALREEWRLTRKLQQDPRVTRWGRVLRRWSLDELPQLLNVLRGQMSLVGPRPLPAYHHADLSPRTVRLREMVRPGITGLWQVSGRSESGEAGIERWDTYYVRNWSVWLDLVVLVRTVGAVFSGRGAY